MSHKHPVYMSHSHFALLTQQDTAGSLSLWDPPPPPATFLRKSLLNAQLGGVQLIFPNS